MGLLKAGIGSMAGVFADQWRDYFYCEAMDVDVLAVKAQKRENRRSSNTKGDENIISNGSIVAVNEGQCMLVVEQGKVVEVCAEPGEFVYDTSTEPSIFYGGLGRGILDTFKTIGKRFAFGGNTAKDQRVYFINTKEIVGNKYGTPNPVPFRVVDKNIGLDIDISIRCNGEYSYKIQDPLLFYTNVCGNVEYVYQRNEIDSMLKSELMTALQPAFAKISQMGIRYSALPGHTMQIADALNDVLSKKWAALRGIKVASFAINSVSASKEDEQMIKNLQKSAALRDPNMAAATLAGAQSDAMRSAAANPNGSMMGFMGMGMAQQSGGINANQLFQMGSSRGAYTGDLTEKWVCRCGTENTGNFCHNCGKPKPEEDSWQCSCGAWSKGNFCPECGKARPTKTSVYQCDRCGWQPKDPYHLPKFCPECGKAFDQNSDE